MIARRVLTLCLLVAQALAAQAAPAVTARYACSDGSRLTATFSPPGAADGSVALRPAGSRRAMKLPQVLSADGGRYALGDREFWIKGNAATYRRGGHAVTCETP
jgi:membrane-bound inhibitor of C-type lysozyme